MKPLNPQQAARLHNRLMRAGLSDTLTSQLFDQLARDVEHYLWIGLPFESALDKTLLEANVGAIPPRPADLRHEPTLPDEQLGEATLDDIVFRFRNRAYGAYNLRQTYSKTLRNALIMAVGLGMMGMVLVHIISRRTWSYWSPWGAVWLTGLVAVTFALVSSYQERQRERDLPVQ